MHRQDHESCNDLECLQGMTGDDRRVGPVIVRRRLGVELRRLREDANLRLEAVADELEVSASKISRIETGHSTAKTWDVRNLLTLYGVTDEERRAEVLSWAADAKAQAWWQDDIAGAPDYVNYYIALEAEAAVVQSYCTPVLHTLLQTDDYARAHLAGYLPAPSAEEIDRLVEVQARRRTGALREGRSFQFQAVVDEASFYRRVGSDAVMKRQLQALTTLPDYVDLRVRPLSAGPHRAILSPFSIFTPRVSDLDPVVVVVEASMTESYLERLEDVSRFQNAFNELSNSALEPSASLGLVRSLVA